MSLHGILLLYRAGLSMLGGCVYAVGGFNGSLRVRTVDVYDAALDQWSSCASMEARRSTLGVAVLGNCIYAVSLLECVQTYLELVYMIIFFI
jgi:Kelch motif.